MSEIKSLTKYKNSVICLTPIYYHFLDGYMSEDVGSYFDIIASYIKK
jgi:hypothetical protein